MRTVANVLSDQKNTPVEIAAVANDNEAYDLAEQFVAVFTEAGWLVTPAVPPTIIAAGPIQDVTIIYADTNDQKYVLIQSALKHVGINSTSKYDPTILKLDRVPIFVSVGKFETEH